MKLRLSQSGDSLCLEGVSSPRDREIVRSSFRTKEIVPGTFSLPKSFSVVHSLWRRFPRETISIDPEVESLVTSPSICQDERLFPFQRRGVDFLVKGNGLLSFAPGLGKTATSVVACDQLEAKKILVITMLTLLPTWQREIQKWSTVGGEIQLLRGEAPRKGVRWFVTNYDYFTRHPINTDWDVIILDESIALKNRDSKRFKAVKSVVTKAKKVWLLSGAPISVDISDLWSQLNLIDPSSFSSYWRFVNEYCIVQETPWARTIAGSRPGISFRVEFCDRVLTVTKEEAEVEIPDMIYENIFCEMTSRQARLYHEASRQFVVDLRSGKMSITSKVAQLTRLSQISSSLKNLDSMEDESGKLATLEELLGVLPKPCIIWTRFVPVAYQIHRMITTSGLIIGETPVSEREDILRAFVQGHVQFLVMGMAVGRYGLTLTNAQSMVYFDLGWNFDEVFQSVNRVHRIGLKHRPTIYKLISAGTIEELIIQNLTDKAQDLLSLTGESLLELLS